MRHSEETQRDQKQRQNDYKETQNNYKDTERHTTTERQKLKMLKNLNAI